LNLPTASRQERSCSQLGRQADKDENESDDGESGSENPDELGKCFAAHSWETGTAEAEPHKFEVGDGPIEELGEGIRADVGAGMDDKPVRQAEEFLRCHL